MWASQRLVLLYRLTPLKAELGVRGPLLDRCIVLADGLRIASLNKLSLGACPAHSVSAMGEGFCMTTAPASGIGSSLQSVVPGCCRAAAFLEVEENGALDLRAMED